MAIGAEIKRLRKASRMTAKDFETLTGIDMQRMYKWEQRDIDPKNEDIIKIQDAFGLPIEEITKLDKFPIINKKSIIKNPKIA